MRKISFVLFAPRGAQARHQGFTLIELMVVLVIIGVLAALIVPNVLNRADDAQHHHQLNQGEALMTRLCAAWSE